MKKVCVYCGKEFEEEDMTREHVIPQVIGGNIEEKNPFIIYNVCKRCNNIAGTYIDGVFAKQFLNKINIDEIQKRYTDINKNHFIPPLYGGKIDEFVSDDRICEMWIGPAGDPIFHFHKPYDEKVDIPMIGKPTYIKENQIDSGFVFVYIVSNNPVWQTTTAYTVNKIFNKSEIYLGNGSHECSEIFSEIPEELEGLHDLITKKLDSKHKFEGKFSSTLHVNDRISFKIALGMSAIFLKSEFVLTNEAKELRNGMWAKEPKDLEKVKVRGQSFTPSIESNRNAVEKYLNMDNCHVITVMKLEEGIYLNISLWGNMNSTILLTEHKELLNIKLKDDIGVVFVIAPGLKKCIGPIALSEFIGFKTGTNLEKRLLDLKKEIDNIPELPPIII